MKMIFVDAENIGLKELEKLSASVIDKVFVFSKADAVKLVCEKSLYTFLSDYPSGSNQADFYIIAFLSRVLVSIDKKHLGSIYFELYTNDESLSSAFEFQCSQFKVDYQVIRTRECTVTNIKQAITKVKTPEQKLFDALAVPNALDTNFQQKLGLSRSEFTKAVNALAKENKIQRTKASKKQWMQC